MSTPTQPGTDLTSVLSLEERGFPFEPAGATGAMGAITPIESGYYTQKLVRVEGQWLIESLQVRHNLPMAF